MYKRLVTLSMITVLGGCSVVSSPINKVSIESELNSRYNLENHFCKGDPFTKYYSNSKMIKAECKVGYNTFKLTLVGDSNMKQFGLSLIEGLEGYNLCSNKDAQFKEVKVVSYNKNTLRVGYSYSCQGKEYTTKLSYTINPHKEGIFGDSKSLIKEDFDKLISKLDNVGGYLCRDNPVHLKYGGVQDAEIFDEGLRDTEIYCGGEYHYISSTATVEEVITHNTLSCPEGFSNFKSSKGVVSYYCKKGEI